ncbi:DinB family protein [Bacillus methanolicus MGA3]|uniref:Uncharacterized protein n=1 Tax=Bacillus methanolicus (strain MGA3 / ATCC 53907) TaxID=796606 RepID=I3E2S5_BACMM|nr:hypothetical protein [Bacillus methanolicus]AIE59104.1 hypothetical protein BMMGA3_03220 [Bacillus methanolicus MGA3]EIJ80796.1 DinB family protein [Bacillus methanolicus MGA3]
MILTKLKKSIMTTNQRQHPCPQKQLVTHILLSFYRFARTAKSGDQMMFREKIEETETDLRKLAENYTEKTRSLLESVQ